MPRFYSGQGRTLPGVKQVLTPAAPAAGQDWSFTVPGGEQWRVLGASAVLVTSAVVANRTPVVKVNAGGLPLFVSANNNAQTATATVTYVAEPVYTPNTTASFVGYRPLDRPDFLLEPGMTFGVATNNIDVGDQWSDVALYVERLYADDATLSTDIEEFDRAVSAGVTQQKA